MNKVFGIFLVLLFSLSGHAQEQVTEATLMEDVEFSLDATVHCLMSVPIAGNALGKEIGLWLRKRQIRKNHIKPLFKKVQTLKSEANAQENIKSEVELFEAQLLEQAVFQKCPQKTEEFFKNVRTYIEFTTVPSTP